jgi:NAD(P)-dependent dehydrogenase (short-subunit alcohol dehydrogenase family)
VNVLQQVHAVNSFLPLIRQGREKKIIYITSGIGDIAVTRVCEMPGLLGYSVSKAGGNIMMAKYAAELKGEGITTLSLSPGWVSTDAGTLAPKAVTGLLG